MKSDHSIRLKLKTLDALMRVSLCGHPMENMDWARMLDTWKLTNNQRALPLELDDDSVHYVRNLNNFKASFNSMYSFNIVRHRINFILNIKRPISIFCREVLQKV